MASDAQHTPTNVPCASSRRPVSRLTWQRAASIWRQYSRHWMSKLTELPSRRGTPHLATNGPAAASRNSSHLLADGRPQLHKALPLKPSHPQVSSLAAAQIRWHRTVEALPASLKPGGGGALHGPSRVVTACAFLTDTRRPRVHEL